MSELGNRKKTKFNALEFLIMNVGVLLLVISVYFFKAPNHFATGGVSGIAIILEMYLPVSQATIQLILNAFLLLVGFIFLGKGCTFKTTYCSLAYSLEMFALDYILDFFNVTLPLTNHMFLEFCYAMLLNGLSGAILFNCNASSGGTDIIALIVKKYSKMNVGNALLITDFFIAFSTFFVFKDATAGLYSLLGLFAKSYLIDGIIESIGKSTYITIITPHPEKLEKYILENLHRGYTSYKARGGYTGEERTVVIAVCKRREAYKLKAQIRSASKESFVILSDVNEIFGKGFKTSV